MTSTRTRRRLTTTAALAALAVAGAAGAWVWSGQIGPDGSGADPQVTGDAESTPGAAVATLVTEPADPAAVATDVPTAQPEPGSTVDVVVSYAGWDASTSAIEVNAFVSGVVEDGGTCAVQLTGPGDTVAVEVAASADASTTICDLMTTVGTELAPGTWGAVVTYTSPAATGVSLRAEVEVPR